MSSDYDVDSITSSSASLHPDTTDDLPECASHSNPDSSNASASSFFQQPDSEKRDSEYDNLDWSTLPGYHMAELSSRTTVSRTGWTWKYGLDIQHQKSGKKYWLCKLCKEKSKTKNKLLLASGTSNHAKHLKEAHSIGKDGPIEKKKKGTIIDKLRATKPREQGIINSVITSFSPSHFRHLLTRWVVHDNIPFLKVQSSYFRDICIYLNPSVSKASCLPAHSTMQKWIIEDFRRHKGTVVELLQHARTSIHISFDLWSAQDLRSMAGVLVHFLDKGYKYREFLLSIPEHVGPHSGKNIAETLAGTFHEFSLHKNLGHVICDNATNNDVAINELDGDFSLSHTKRIRCAGHIINLVARKLLFGYNPDALEYELDNLGNESDAALDQWRKMGPLGKLNNVVVWISKSGQRKSKFRELQHRNQMEEDGSSSEKLYDLVMANATRWNSFFAMLERALKLRMSIDDYCSEEKNLYERQQRNRGRGRSARNMTPPVIVRDALSADDWDVVAQYYQFLKPLATITKRLEGTPEHGRLGCVWEVIPMMEYLLHKFESWNEEFLLEEDDNFYKVRGQLQRL